MCLEINSLTPQPFARGSFLRLFGEKTLAMIALVFAFGLMSTVGVAQTTVYNSVPSPLAASYPSQPFQAQQTREFGDFVHLAGTNRLVNSVTMTMVSWAYQSEAGNVAYCAAHPTRCSGAGWTHDFTLNIYNIGAGAVGTRDIGSLVATITQNKTVPWRPAPSANCSGNRWQSIPGPFDTNCNNGFAYNVTFDMSSLNQVIPNDVVVGIVYNTETYGPAPMAEVGPFNSLNVGTQPGPAAVGTDDSSDRVFWNTLTPGWYSDGGASGSNEFREDSAWTGYGTIPIQINAIAASLVVDDDGLGSAGNCDDATPANTTIAAAYTFAAPGNTITVCPGTYANPATINLNKANTTITWAGTTKPVVQAPNAPANLFNVSATGVTVSNLEIQKTDPHSPSEHNLIAVGANNFTASNNLIYGPNPGGTWSAVNLYSRAFVISALTGTLITNNVIHTFRQPGYMSGGVGTGGTISNNQVSGTRGWVVEGGDYLFTGNTFGEPQNQGCDIALLGTIIAANQTFYLPLLTLSTNNDNAFICQQYGALENGRATGYVDDSAVPSGNGSDNAKYQSINAGIAGTLIGGTVQVAAGTYNEDVSINKFVKLAGAGPGTTTITGPFGGNSQTVWIAADNIELSGFRITRDGNNPTDWNNPNINNGGGVTIQGAFTGANIHDNRIEGNRTGIDINNSSGHSVHNNEITNNRTGMIFRNQTDNIAVFENEITDNWTLGIVFLDGSGGTNTPVQTALNSPFNNNDLSGNWYGAIVERQVGGALPAPGTTSLKNFNGNWFGTPTPVRTTANSAEPGYAAQIPVIFGGTASAPGGQPDIAGPASANIDYSPFLATGTDTLPGTMGFQGNPLDATITADGAHISPPATRLAEGLAFVPTGGTLRLASGTYTGNLDTSGKALTIAPGASPGQVFLIGNLTLDSNDTLAIEVNGTNPATLYDNFVVTGTVTLGGATLALSGSYTPTGSDSFTIIDNDAADPVSGIFATKPENSVVTLNSVALNVSYVDGPGGTGNNVVLGMISGPCITITTAPHINSLTNVDVTIPVTIGDTTGRQMTGAQFRFNYDPSVLSSSPPNITVTNGTVAPSPLIVVNTVTPGVILVSISTTAPFTGAGVLVNLNMKVVGPIGSTTPTDLQDVLLFKVGPQQIVCATVADSTLTIISAGITGNVTYKLERFAQPTVTQPVPLTTISAIGPTPPAPAVTDALGNYAMSGFAFGTYNLSPAKPDKVCGLGPFNGIGSNDATLIARTVVFLDTMSTDQQEAAQVANLGFVNSLDASLVARFAVCISTPGSLVGTWRFKPLFTPAPGPINTVSGGTYNYFALLMGDVTGDWSPTGPLRPAFGDASKAVRVHVPNVDAQTGSTVTVPLTMENLRGQGIGSYQFDIKYDPRVIEPADVAAELTETLGASLNIVSNSPEPGHLKVAVYGILPVTGDGVYANLKFNVIGEIGTKSPVDIAWFEYNNGGTYIAHRNGSVNVAESTGAIIKGRLVSSEGQGIRSTRVVLTNDAGEKTYAVTGSFGTFEFGGLTVGRSYTITAESKRFRFAPQIISAADGATSLEMIALD